jgi:hypothetical protein
VKIWRFEQFLQFIFKKARKNTFCNDNRQSTINHYKEQTINSGHQTNLHQHTTNIKARNNTHSNSSGEDR